MAIGQTPEERIAALKREAQLAYQINEDVSKSIGSMVRAAADYLRIQSEINKLIKEENELRAAGKIDDADAIEQLREEYQLRAKILGVAVKSGKNIAEAALNTVGRGLSDIYDKLKTIALNGVSYFYEQDKAIRSSQLSMGILNKDSKAFANNIFKASQTTTVMGSNAAELAEMQASYSDEIGRAVILSEDGLVAMTKMAHGTSLGAEGAASMAAEMAKFGVSVTQASSYVESTLTGAHALGVNTALVFKNLQTNLKIAQGYTFKTGVKGIAQMTIESAKSKINFEDITGMADKLMDPEGAIEMAAQLQVLGGAWSRIADPFTLMYQARNAPDELAKSLAEATSATAKFNKTTGEVEISALEMQRLRKVAEATGLDYTKLAESARMAAQYTTIDTTINTKLKGNTNVKKFLETTAQWDENKKEFYVTLDAGGIEKTYLKDLKDSDSKLISTAIEQKKNLTEQATTAQSFDTLWTNILNTVKTYFLPFLDGVFEGIRDPLMKFTDWSKNSDFFTSLKATGKSIGKNLGDFITTAIPKIQTFAVQVTSIVSTIASWMTKAPWLTVALLALGNGAMWLANGALLGTGFMGATRMFGGLSSGSGSGGGFGSKMGVFGKVLGVAEGVTAVAASSYAGYKLAESGETGTGYAVGIGLGALSGARAGALILPPPWGELIGAAIGAIAGGVSTYMGSRAADEANKVSTQTKMNDFISRPGEGAVPFSSNDTLVGLKKGGPIAENLSESNTTDKMHHTFDTIKINLGTLKLDGINGSGKLNLDEEAFLGPLGTMISKGISMNLNGGKLNPNPNKA